MPCRLRSLARAGLLASALVALLEWVAASADHLSTEGQTAALSYVGSEACRSCHGKQYAAWSTSLHAAAMRRPGEAPVIGAGAGKQRANWGAGSTRRVLMEDGALVAEFTESGATSTQRHRLPFLLGRRPMEQYLAEGENGRLQPLPFAYDTSEREWFDVAPGETHAAGEYRHWLSPGMNANTNCLECHTTNYRKGFDAAADAYRSTWSELGVGCESCHGPGAAHAAEPKTPYPPFGKDAGLADWRPSLLPAELRAGAPPPVAASAMLDVCASCHALRRTLAEGFSPGRPFLDYFDPVLLDEAEYRADGIVEGQAFEWGSFMQSRMHARGVTCLACHDVHGGELHSSPATLCTSCHTDKAAPDALAAHTHHLADGAASWCISCHMPEKVFMGRDHRRDHSFSIPDPVLARDLEVASACEACHASMDRTALATKAVQWWPRLLDPARETSRRVARAFGAARSGEPGREGVLRACLSGELCNDPIRRAAAAKLLAGVVGQEPARAALLAALHDEEPLVRAAAAAGLCDVDLRLEGVAAAVAGAAGDPVASVRAAAAWTLRRVSLQTLAPQQSAAVERAFAQWRRSAELDADRLERCHELGIFETARGNTKAAQSAYRQAIKLAPQVTSSHYNLAMLLIAGGRVDQARSELETVVAADPSLAAAWYGLGAIHAEQQRWKDAVVALQACLKADPLYPRALTDLTHAYLKAGVANVARAVLTAALRYPGARREALAGLIVVALEEGSGEEASRLARQLVEVDPASAADPEIARLAAAGNGS